MRSFSKAHGLAGARIRYMISEKKKIRIFQIQREDMKQMYYLLQLYIFLDNNLTKICT